MLLNKFTLILVRRVVKWMMATALTTTLIVATIARAEVVVVVSPDNPLSSLNKKQLSNIFLGKSNRFPGGGRAEPVNQQEGAPGRKEFYNVYTGKSPAQIKQHWSKMIFTGRGQPPREVKDNSELKILLAENRATIAYVDTSLVDNSMKVLVVK